MESDRVFMKKQTKRAQNNRYHLSESDESAKTGEKLHAEKKYQVIIFGDKNHKEVKSIGEWSGKKRK